MDPEKYVILVGDGMGDYPVAELGGRTPLEAAHTPHLDRLAGCGLSGLVQTIPEGMEAGSDIANMSLLGYDPARYHTGRAPLEAASMGVQLAADDIALRCNLVTIEADADQVPRMADYSAGHITTEEAHRLIASLQEAVRDLPLSLYPGVSYRHLLVWHGGRDRLGTTPPHDISGQPAAPHREAYQRHPVLQAFIEAAAKILAAHPVNRDRIEAGRRPASAVWLWGEGRAPAMPTLDERFGLRGAMISAVDLLKGLGVYAGLTPVAVPGATGYLDTNYRGKVDAALSALVQGNFVYLHVEAPDEAGHEGSLEKKVSAIEAFDREVVGPILAELNAFSAVRVLVAADHFTPVSVRTHTRDPSLFVMADGPFSDSAEATGNGFSERSARLGGRYFASGVELFTDFIQRPRAAA